MLIKKMWRDLFRNKAQFISIFLMALLAMWIYAGMDATSAGLKKSSYAYFDAHNLADLWISGIISDDDIKVIERTRGVASAERYIATTGKVVDSVGNPIRAKESTNVNAKADSGHYLFLEYLTNGEISNFKLYDGEPYSESGAGIWLEQRYCEANDIQVGDDFHYETDGIVVDTTVKGIIDAPEYVSYAAADELLCNYSICCLGFASAEKGPMSAPVFNHARIKISKDADADIVKNQLITNLDRDDIVVYGRDQNAGTQLVDDEVASEKAMGVLFAAAFVMIALLGIITTMTRVTASQRTQIGTLKALGFSKAKITWHYVSYAAVICSLGAVLGAVAGYIVMPMWIYPMYYDSMILPELESVFSSTSVTAVILSIVISVAVSFLSCRKELADPPAATLRPKTPKKTKVGFIAKSRLWHNLSFSTRWNLRDISRNKVRSLMAIIGIMGCAMLMSAALGVNDTNYAMFDAVYGEQLTARNKVNFSGNTDYGCAYDYARQYDGQMIQEGRVELASANAKRNGVITVLDEGNFCYYKDENENKIELTRDGIAMSRKMAELLRTSKGDIISWRLIGENEWKKARIQQLYTDPSSQGITMYRDIFEGFEYDFRPTAIMTNKSIPKNVIDNDKHIASVMDYGYIKAAAYENADNSEIIAVLIVAAVILGFVVLYNLGILSFVEKTREMATLKVLGFSTGKVRNILQKQNIWLTAIGAAVGIYMGYELLGALLMGPEEMDAKQSMSLMTKTIACLGTFAVSICVNYMFSAKVKAIDMVDALKGVE